MLRTALFTLLLAIVFFVAEYYFGVRWLHPAWKYMLVFFAGIGFLTDRLIATGLQDNQERFIPMYMAVTVSRLLLGLAFVGFFLWQRVPQRKTFILDFLVLYIIYAGFEIWLVTRNLRQNS